jgi:hypothetical protein
MGCGLSATPLGLQGINQMLTRLKIVSISLMAFIPIFLGVLFLFAPKYNYLYNSEKLLVYLISVGFIELVLIGVLIYSRKRIVSNPKYSEVNKNIDVFKKYWWAYLSVFILVPTIIYYLLNYSGGYSEILNHIVFLFVGLFFIIYKPISQKGIFSRKLELSLGLAMLIITLLLILSEILL